MKFSRILTAVLTAGMTTLVAFSAAAADNNGPMFSVVGSAIQSQSRESGNGITLDGKLGLGGGLLVAIPTGHDFGFEIGGLYFNRKFDKIGSNVTNTGFSQKSIYVPADFRFGLAEVLSLGLGGYYDLALDGGNDNDYGLQGGLRLSFPMAATTAFILDGRYSYGLRTDVFGSRSKDIIAMAGFTFNMPNH
ncbi:MAG: hypothetical protein H7222_07295 [Methylotenera sp.]|nr:hypothetical protein [Oligoflexia bacterium]